MALNMAYPKTKRRGESEQEDDKKKIAGILRGCFTSTENHKVDDNQHQYDDVKAHPVRDRGAMEHYAMLAYGDLLKK